MTGEKEKPKTGVSWRAAEFDFVPKGVVWHAWAGIITLALVGIALWQQNFFFAIFLLIAGSMVLVLGNKRPETFDFTIDEDGCHIGTAAMYPLDQLEDYSIYSRPHRLDELIIRRKSAVHRVLHIPIDSETAEKVKVFLEDKLPEIEHEPSLLESIADILGF